MVSQFFAADLMNSIVVSGLCP